MRLLTAIWRITADYCTRGWNLQGVQEMMLIMVVMIVFWTIMIRCFVLWINHVQY